MLNIPSTTNMMSFSMNSSLVFPFSDCLCFLCRLLGEVASIYPRGLLRVFISLSGCCPFFSFCDIASIERFFFFLSCFLSVMKYLAFVANNFCSGIIHGLVKWSILGVQLHQFELRTWCYIPLVHYTLIKSEVVRESNRTEPTNEILKLQ